MTRINFHITQCRFAIEKVSKEGKREREREREKDTSSLVMDLVDRSD